MTAGANRAEATQGRGIPPGAASPLFVAAAGKAAVSDGFQENSLECNCPLAVGLTLQEPAGIPGNNVFRSWISPTQSCADSVNDERQNLSLTGLPWRKQVQNSNQTKNRGSQITPKALMAASSILLASNSIFLLSAAATFNICILHGAFQRSYQTRRIQ